MSLTTTLCVLLVAFATPAFPAKDPPTSGNAGARPQATRSAKLIALTFVRTSELRKALRSIGKRSFGCLRLVVSYRYRGRQNGIV